MNSTKENKPSTSPFATFRPELIYIFRITGDTAHQGCLKIGKTTMPDEASLDAEPNSHILKEAARARILQYTKTAAVQWELLHTESAIARYQKQVFCINDTDVHQVLLRSGISRADFGADGGREWFRTDLRTAIAAIAAAKQRRLSLLPDQVTLNQSPIEFRPEQREAIERTCKKFAKSGRMLWNAKMRFGKTLCALEVVRRQQFRRTLILTHRPVVNAGWYDDFQKIFRFEQTLRFDYGSKTTQGNSLPKMESDAQNEDLHYIYFASMQDLRGSEQVGGKFDKNDQLFSIPWNCIIVDEAHEGTQTELGQNVLSTLKKDTTKILELSGTPFNLFDHYKEDEIYTWDYVMEQRAKTAWNSTHFGDPNPYAALPTMNIFTFDLANLMKAYMDIDMAFNFTEFFRVREDGAFAHESDVNAFLNLLTKDDPNSMFPFANAAFRSQFHHTLWMLPGVKAAKALSAMLRRHPVFSTFEVVNVAGNGDDDAERGDALTLVQGAIRSHDYTITLSCGKLTTGVSVPEWTAVLMLSGTVNTAASSYMQTIFRVQTPATINGQRKENCYVFDFAPDRTLRVIADTAKVQTKAGKTSESDRQTITEFLNFCPIIAYDGTQMKTTLTAKELFERLKKSYIGRVVSSGFDTGDLYDSDQLLKLDNIDLQNFRDLQKHIGSTKAMPRSNTIDINAQGLTNEEHTAAEETEKKKRQGKTLTDEEKEQLRQLAEARKNRLKAIAILRGISIRMPLLIYGAELKQGISEVTLDNFTSIIDDSSWLEFMPAGVTKEDFAKFRKYYDPEIFLGAGKHIRALAEAADRMSVEQRISQITTIFNSFRNPDKETVLTPWRVVNRHLGDTLGGYNFYNDDYSHEIPDIDCPRYIEHPGVTDSVFSPDSRVLEINSKSGLYPLYMAYSIYRAKVRNRTASTDTIEQQQTIWDEVIRQNIFVICKTEMARSITRRTLLGFRYDTNTRGGFDNLYVPDNLINRITNEQSKFIEQINKGQTFKKFAHMKFNAVVGNPPYQYDNHLQIYPYFYLIARKLGDYVSMIFPIGWQQPKNANGLRVLNTEEIKADRQIIKINNLQNIFPQVPGAEWVNIILWKSGYDNGLDGKQWIYTNDENPQQVQLIWNTADIEKPAEIRRLVECIKQKGNFIAMQSVTSSLKPYGLRTDVLENFDKYHLAPFQNERHDPTDIRIWAKNNVIRYIPRNYPLPAKTKAFDKYKVLVPYAWGNMSSNYLGGAYANIVVAKPYEICLETYLESGCFDDLTTAQKHAKYLMTKFARAVLFSLKFSQHSTTAWGNVPVQDYTEDWWNESIAQIDEHLFDKYDLPQSVRSFIRENIQPRNETNIKNL